MRPRQIPAPLHCQQPDARLVVLLALCLVLCVTGHWPGSAQAPQQAEHIIKSVYVSPEQQSPVEVVGVKVKGVPVELGRKFTADSDWLDGLTFTLKNVSDKPVAHVRFSLAFPMPPGAQTEFLLHVLSYGVEPTLPAPAGASPRVVAPGQTFDIEMTELEYQRLLGDFARYGLPANAPAAEYDIESVFFAGEPDTKWGHGFLMQRDPLRPTRFTVREKYVLPKRPE